jgi:hypothetical protein
MTSSSVRLVPVKELASETATEAATPAPARHQQQAQGAGYENTLLTSQYTSHLQIIGTALHDLLPLQLLLLLTSY